MIKFLPLSSLSYTLGIINIKIWCISLFFFCIYMYIFIFVYRYMQHKSFITCCLTLHV